MPEEQDDHITKPSIIAAHLGRLQREHQLVKLNIVGTDNSFNSMLVSIDPAKQTMLLDVLHPDTAHQQLIKKKDFNFNVESDGVKISFNGTIQKLVEDDGKPAYFVNFPDKLLYKQRRQAFRAPISKGDLLSITLTDTEMTKSCKGIIDNVSRGGLCLQIDHGENWHFEKFSILSAQFFTTENIEIICDIEVRNIKPDQVYKHTKVGVQFKNLDKQQKRHIQNFALRMERQMIKRQRA